MNIKQNIAVSGAGMIFNPNTGETYTVNPIGAEIISRIKEGQSLNEMSEKIIAKYSVEKSTFQNDYEDFVNLMRNFSLIEDGD
jgi:hypothetical protein